MGYETSSGISRIRDHQISSRGIFVMSTQDLFHRAPSFCSNLKGDTIHLWNCHHFVNTKNIDLINMINTSSDFYSIFLNDPNLMSVYLMAIPMDMNFIPFS